MSYLLGAAITGVIIAVGGRVIFNKLPFIQLFVIGFLYHVLVEFTGLYTWYSSLFAPIRCMTQVPAGLSTVHSGL